MEETSTSTRWRFIGGALYFTLQGAGIITWWLAMFAFPSIQKHFQAYPVTKNVQPSALYPDLILLAGGSWLCALLLWRAPRHVWSQRAAWSMVGAFAYPAIHATSTMWRAGGKGWAATMLMLTFVQGSFLAAWTIRLDGPLFQVAPQRSTSMHILRTLIQTAVFWCMALVLVPWLVTSAEHHLGVPHFTTPMQRWLPWLLFALVGALNIHTGITMSRWGKGTPLPLETARDLVVRGLYRYVRNPMAVTGLFLGLMIGWWLGSWGTLLAVVMGGIFWNVFVRPIEEKDLLERFGEPYRQYTQKIGCWLPTFPPHPPLPHTNNSQDTTTD
ncbi:MAG TPA: hypothetical protein DCE42_13890 [Myxococcales bacterium]|nr:hypothetical protein [Deltaproteobacteria bacterium]MBU50972.1 hypothetical protein [Deltaproteobacteria bacterium]HAA55849.1 hypothetical protein [Myxococcales bacterium]